MSYALSSQILESGLVIKNSTTFSELFLNINNIKIMINDF